MTDYEKIEAALRFAQTHYREQPSLSELARVSGLSESHFVRVFTRWCGTTPKSYLKFLTAQHAKDLLIRSKDVLSVSLESGLSGPSRLHDLMITLEAATPAEVAKRGRGVEIHYAFHDSPFGFSLAGITSRGLCHFSFTDRSPESQRRALDEMRRQWPEAHLIADKKSTSPVVRDIFTKRRGRPMSLFVSGTPFQLKVWEALLKIPEGSVVSYSGLAKSIGVPRASRAVGSAIGANSIAYLIPCHRVIRETGHFGDYRWGLDRKRAILATEIATEITAEIVRPRVSF